MIFTEYRAYLFKIENFRAMSGFSGSVSGMCQSIGKCLCQSIGKS